MSLKEPQIPGEKKNKNETPFVNSSTGIFTDTSAKFQDLSFKNGVNIRAFVRKTCVICVVALYVLGVRMGSTFDSEYDLISVLGVKMGSTFDSEYDLISALRSQIFEYVCETFHRYALESWDTDSFRILEKKKKKAFFFVKTLHSSLPFF